MPQNNLHQWDEKSFGELITVLKVQIATVSMPLREENREEGEEREKERSVCRKLSLPCSIMGVLNTAKHFRMWFGTGKGAQQNRLYFISGCAYGCRSPLSTLLPSVFLFCSNFSRCYRGVVFSPLLYIWRYTGCRRSFISSWLLGRYCFDWGWQ